MPTQTPTTTPTFCPQPSPQPLFVEPVTSPTNLLSQTIVVYNGNAESIDVSSESGVFTLTGNVGTPAEIPIDLLPNLVHHLVVSAHFPPFGIGDCQYEGYTLSRQFDKFGAPLVIIQLGQSYYLPFVNNGG